MKQKTTSNDIHMFTCRFTFSFQKAIPCFRSSCCWCSMHWLYCHRLMSCSSCSTNLRPALLSCVYTTSCQVCTTCGALIALVCETIVLSYSSTLNASFLEPIVFTALYNVSWASNRATCQSSAYWEAIAHLLNMWATWSSKIVAVAKSKISSRNIYISHLSLT